MLLSGKTAIISGAAGPRGIGFAAARLFAEQGARVAIFDIDQSAAEAAAQRAARTRFSCASPYLLTCSTSSRNSSGRSVPCRQSRSTSLE